MAKLDRKGQLFFFIFLGIITLILFGIIFYVRGQANKLEPTSQQVDSNSFEFFASECLRETTRFALEKQGSQGGTLQLPDRSFDSDFIQTSIIRKQPNAEQMQSELERFIESGISQCLNGFRTSSAQNFTYSGQPKAKVMFTQRDVSVSLNYPISVISGRTRREISQFHAEIPVRITSMLGLTGKILEMDKINMNLLYDSGYEIHAVHYPDTDIFIIIDRLNRIEPYAFIFAKDKMLKI
jgi:hypothetical protein